MSLDETSAVRSFCDDLKTRHEIADFREVDTKKDRWRRFIDRFWHDKTIDIIVGNKVFVITKNAPKSKEETPKSNKETSKSKEETPRKLNRLELADRIQMHLFSKMAQPGFALGDQDIEIVRRWWFNKVITTKPLHTLAQTTVTQKPLTQVTEDQTFLSDGTTVKTSQTATSIFPPSQPSYAKATPTIKSNEVQAQIGLLSMIEDLSFLKLGATGNEVIDTNQNSVNLALTKPEEEIDIQVVRFDDSLDEACSEVGNLVEGSDEAPPIEIADLKEQIKEYSGPLITKLNTTLDQLQSPITTNNVASIESVINEITTQRDLQTRETYDVVGLLKYGGYIIDNFNPSEQSLIGCKIPTAELLEALEAIHTKLTTAPNKLLNEPLTLNAMIGKLKQHNEDDVVISTELRGILSAIVTEIGS